MGQGLGTNSTWDGEAGAVARARIVELRRDNVEFEEIGRQLWEAGQWPTPMDHPPSRQAVWRQWRRALAAIPAPALAAYRAELAELLGEQYRRAQEILDRDHVAHSNGQVVYIDGKPVLDDGPKLAAIREQRMIVAQMSVLAGANAPVQQKITMDATVEYSVVGVDVEALK
jgi:hypothetical protein